MKRDTVKLTADEQVFICRSMVEKLNEWSVEWIDLSVDPTHFHLLVRFQPIDGRMMNPSLVPP
ncbi:MAG: hypothetical protein GC164_15820 [Phycisphaera sp.]|nr:hypothetical protein [Phycisphaera sp.]